jgi:hypothetical protein
MRRIVVTHADLVATLQTLTQDPRAHVSGPASVTYAADLLEVRAISGHPQPHQRPPAALLHAATLTLALNSRESLGHQPLPDLLPAHPTVVHAGLLFVGSGSTRRLHAVLQRPDGPLERVDEVRIVGPGMPILANTTTPRLTPLPPALALRFSRLIGTLGPLAWHRLTDSHIVVAGCGRTGSLVALSLARLGLARVTLIDPDHLEEHNLDAMDGVGMTDLGRPKVHAVRDAMQAVWPQGRVIAHARSLTALDALPLLRAGEVLISCVDDDGARWAAAVAATLYLMPLLDIGVGVHGQGAQRQMGADVRLALPGDGCLLCWGGVARPEQVATLRGATGRRAHAVRDWRDERAGSLRSLNQIAVGLGLRLLEDLYAGRVNGSRWVRLSIDAGGTPTIMPMPAPTVRRSCPLCALRGLGDAGVGQIGRLPDTGAPGPGP